MSLAWVRPNPLCIGRVVEAGVGPGVVTEVVFSDVKWPCVRAALPTRLQAGLQLGNVLIF